MNRLSGMKSVESDVGYFQVNAVLKGKEKERKSIYIAPFCTKVHT